jgi:ferritin-like metal-binding protein YciE
MRSRGWRHRHADRDVRTLGEEEATDKKLTELAESTINPEAALLAEPA